MNLKLQRKSRTVYAFLMALFSVLGWGQTTMVTLPHTRTTWDSTPTGWIDTPLDSYTSSFACSTNNGAKFDTSGDSKIVRLDSTPDKLSFVVKSNAATTSSLLVQQSSDGTNYTTVINLSGTTDLPTTCTTKGNYQLLASTRYIRWTFTKGSQNMTMDDVSITKLTSPTLSATGNLTSFTYVEGNGPSAAQSVSISGSNLNNNAVTVTAPSNFEVSLDGNTYGTSQNLPYSNGAFANQSVYVRLGSGLAAGNYSGNIIISGGGAADVVKAVEGQVAFPISAVSNNTSFGTVSVLDNVITANPLAGYTYASPAYTVISGSATVSQNGNQFTVTPSAATQVQINFEAKPSYTLSLMNNGSAYTNANFPFVTYEGNTITLPTLPDCGSYTFAGWDISNSTTSAPTYVGGATYTTTAINTTLYAVYQTTSGTPSVTYSYGFEENETGWTSDATKSNQQAKTGSYSGRINTNNVHVTRTGVVASPTSISFSLMRTSTNTNYNIEVQTSSDNSTWTPVVTYPMSDFANGSWTEKTTDLSAYQNVHVRLYYDGTTAIRYIDDIRLVEGGLIISYTTMPNCSNASTTWNGAAWSSGTPAASTDVIITGAYSTTSQSSFTANNITIKNGGVLEITSGNTIGAVDVTVEDGGNLIQKDGSTLSYTGDFKALKNGTSEINKYAFWSSPVEGQILANIYTGATPTSITQYNTANDSYTNAGTTSEFAKAYSFKTPVSNAALVFEGTPNNGTQTFLLATSGNGFNLIGNPYPSSLDLGAFYAANSARISSTFYFWDNKSTNVTLQNGATTTNYGYATFNAANGANPTWVPAPNGNGGTAVVPAGGIANIGQGFIVKTLSTSVDTSLAFNNDMRVATGGTFFNKNNSLTEGKFWLRLNSEYNTNNTFAVDYTNAASDSFDSYDSKAIGMGSDAFYTLTGTQKLIIQGRESFDTDDVVPVGVKHFQNGNFTIALVQKEGVFNNGQAIYLHDKVTGTYTDLQNGAYTFAANAGENTNRFEIVYKLNVLATAEAQKDSFEVYRDGQDFMVRNNKNIEKVEIFDAAGRKIQTINESSKLIRVQLTAKGVYILKALSEGKEYTKKIIK
ncbi:T9SS type A sorting domain-containing protein [Chryseobacterium sp. 2TAF14]|uniref:T9SS type A sorting domain-containing protein n=1 Tax=Chryseobacterium sp. 2TAF14 TaxID=3233007 RepID=UPI003F9084B6